MGGAVDALVAVKAHEVELTPFIIHVTNGIEECGVAVEASILDAPVYLLEGLPDDPSCTHGKVARLASALGSLGDSDGVPRALEESPGVLLQVPVVVWSMGEVYRVTLFLLGVAPAVPHDEDDPHDARLNRVKDD